ncbi:hypothetical protein [Tahibacter aquaticus]|uniref:hypothetical protein n=1 Tax=Tahibacter aquaticus TaxID=520092 RepID=UPI00105D04A4|nr:hypothetical protein [Tahibacter aquaticus]
MLLKAFAGRRSNPPSALLRNLAWMRYLLNELHRVERWAWGDEAPPTAWTNQRALDAQRLGEVFRASPRRVVPDDLSQRRASLLDRVFAGVLGGTSGGGRYFGDRLYRGKTQPNETHLAWFDDLVPGSRAAFDREPPGMDRWFYDALDFQSPRFGEVFLNRAGDPQFRQSEWTDEGKLAPGDSGQRFPDADVPMLSAAVLRLRDERWQLSDADDESLAKLARGAAFEALRPDLAYDTGSSMSEAACELAAAAASGSDPEHCSTVSELREAPLGVRWAALSNTIGAHRLAAMVYGSTETTRWCFRAARGAIQADIDRLQPMLFCTVAGRTGPLDAALNAVDALRA